MHREMQSWKHYERMYRLYRLCDEYQFPFERQRMNRNFLRGLLLLLLFLPPAKAQSNSGPVPPIIVASMNAYRDEGSEAAVKILLKNSLWMKENALDESGFETELVNQLNGFSTRYGRFRRFDVAGVRQLSSSTVIYYLILDYDKAPVFARFILYRTIDAGWILNEYKLDSTMDNIIPPAS
jgi:hypothetical protein